MSRAFTILGILASAICAAELPHSGGKWQTAQYGLQERLSVGSILVANEKLTDPNFAESVVLIVQYDSDEGTVGLIINRRSEIPLSKVSQAQPAYKA